MRWMGCRRNTSRCAPRVTGAGHRFRGGVPLSGRYPRTALRGRFAGREREGRKQRGGARQRRGMGGTAAGYRRGEGTMERPSSGRVVIALQLAFGAARLAFVFGRG
jgi:hypothetical protein